MNAIDLIEALKGADGETGLELIERLQCGRVDCSVLPTEQAVTSLPDPQWPIEKQRAVRGLIARILAGWDEEHTVFKDHIAWLSVNRELFISKEEMAAAYEYVRGESNE